MEPSSTVFVCRCRIYRIWDTDWIKRNYEENILSVNLYTLSDPFTSLVAFYYHNIRFQQVFRVDTFIYFQFFEDDI